MIPCMGQLKSIIHVLDLKTCHTDFKILSTPAKWHALNYHVKDMHIANITFGRSNKILLLSTKINYQEYSLHTSIIPRPIQIFQLDNITL